MQWMLIKHIKVYRQTGLENIGIISNGRDLIIKFIGQRVYEITSATCVLADNSFLSTDIDLNGDFKSEVEKMSKIIKITCPKLEPLRETFIKPQREIDRKYRYNHYKK